MVFEVPGPECESWEIVREGGERARFGGPSAGWGPLGNLAPIKEEAPSSDLHVGLRSPRKTWANDMNI